MGFFRNKPKTNVNMEEQTFEFDDNEYNYPSGDYEIDDELDNVDIPIADMKNKKLNRFGNQLNVYEFNFIEYILSIYNWYSSEDIVISGNRNMLLELLTSEFQERIYYSRCNRFMITIENRIEIIRSYMVPSERLKIVVSRTKDNKIIHNHIVTQKELRKSLIEIKFNPDRLLYFD